MRLTACGVSCWRCCAPGSARSTRSDRARDPDCTPRCASVELLPFAAPRSLSQQLLFAMPRSSIARPFRPRSFSRPTAAPSTASHRRRTRAQGARTGRTGRRGAAQRRDMAGAGADPSRPSLDGTRSGAEAPPDDGSCDASSGEVGSCDAPSGENATPSPEMTRADEKQTNLKKYGVLPAVPAHRSHGQVRGQAG